MGNFRGGGIFASQPKEVSVTQFQNDIQAGAVAKVDWQRDKLTVTYRDKTEARVNAYNKETPSGTQMQEIINAHNKDKPLDEQELVHNEDPVIRYGSLGIKLRLLVPAGLIFAVVFLFIQYPQTYGN